MTPANATVVTLRHQHGANLVSDRIRHRLAEAGHGFFANDNIAAFIHDGELDELRTEVEARLEDVLHALIIDTALDHNTNGTAHRVAKMFIDETFRGRYCPEPDVTTFPNVAQLGELMTVGPIKVRSTCAHHFCPITGKVWIGVLPDPHSRLIGLSKYARICAWVMTRPQIQEEAVTMLADELERRVRPQGLVVLMEASHFCMGWRGVKEDESLMRTTVTRGALAYDVDLKKEFFSLIGKQAG